MLRTHEQKMAQIKSLAQRDHDLNYSGYRYTQLVNAGDEEYAEEYACERRRLAGFLVQHALSAPGCERIIPGSTAYGCGTQRSLIETNRENGNLKMFNGGKLWRSERKASSKPGSRWTFTAIATVAADGTINYL